MEPKEKEKTVTKSNKDESKQLSPQKTAFEASDVSQSQSTSGLAPPPPSFAPSNIPLPSNLPSSNIPPAGYYQPSVSYSMQNGVAVPFIPFQAMAPPVEGSYDQFVAVNPSTASEFDPNAAPMDPVGSHMFKYFDMYSYQKSREWDQAKNRNTTQPKVTKKQIKMFKRKKKLRQQRSFKERLDA